MQKVPRSLGLVSSAPVISSTSNQMCIRDRDMYDDKVYERAHDTLWQWVEDGTFLTEDKKCYYLYELTMRCV